jgi:hypothetical protein
VSQALECGDARAMLAGLDARNGGVARPHALGELLLREPEFGSTHDHEPSDSLERSQTRLRGSILRVAAAATSGGVRCRRPGRTYTALAHVRSLPIMVRHGKNSP